MPYVALGLLLLVGLLAVGQIFVRASPRTVARALKAAGVISGTVLLLFLIVTGRAAVLISLAPLALFAALAYRQTRRRWAAAGAPRPGASSGVTTRYFRMSLDHDTGAVSGEVLAGRFSGRGLADMSLDDLLELRRDCADDPQSISVLEAYLDRLHPDWRERGSGQAGDRPPGSAMTVEEGTTRGRKMRVDTTVVEAPIRHPTDSRLCEDAVRVLRRNLVRLVGAGVRLPFRLRNVHRAVCRRAREIAQALRLRGERAMEAIKKPYRGLLRITARLVRQAEHAITEACLFLGRERDAVKWGNHVDPVHGQPRNLEAIRTVEPCTLGIEP